MKYNKYIIQKLQISHDNGETWEDVSPSVTRFGKYVGTYSTLNDCISGDSVIDDIVITEEMKNTWYTIIMPDGTYYAANQEDLAEGDGGDYWISPDNPHFIELYHIDTMKVLDDETMSQDWAHISEAMDYIYKNAVGIVIGKMISQFDGGFLDKFKRVRKLYLQEGLQILGNLATRPNYVDLPNLETIELPKSLHTYAISFPYIKELVFYGDIDISVATRFSPSLESITVYGNLYHTNFEDYSAYSNYKTPNLREILCYGYPSLQNIAIPYSCRLYIPDNSLVTKPCVLPMSLHKYNIYNLDVSSDKAVALNIYGQKYSLPQNGSSTLGKEEVDEYFSATTHDYYDGRNGKSEIAFVRISSSVTRIDTDAFDAQDKWFMNIHSMLIPSTVTALGTSAFRGALIQNIIFDGLTPPTNLIEGLTYEQTGLTNTHIGRIYVHDEVYNTYASLLTYRYDLIKILRPLSEYMTDNNKNYTPKPCEEEYQWVLTSATTCVGYDKYRLYKKQKRCPFDGAAWEDVVPAETSYDGNGTMPTQLVQEKSADCGYNNVGLVATLVGDGTCTSECNNGRVTLCSNISNVVKLEFRECVTYIDSLFATNSSSLTSITMTNSVTTIGSNAFQNNTSLARVTLSDNLQTINPYTFYGCSSLSVVNIPSSCTSIGDSAFYGCTSLPEEMRFHSPLNTIGDNAFNGCTSIGYIYLPTTITSIGSSAFANCTSLISIVCYATTPPSIASNTFSNVDSEFIIIVPYASVDLYKSASGWSTYSNRIEGRNL